MGFNSGFKALIAKK